jgi:CheY-like chemotaxis protein
MTPAGGEITIETADIVLDELYARSHASARSGPHVVLAVSDNGHGMSPDVQARAFEPFFTTKPSGQGTGLGLATVYGIVKQSGGHLWIYSEVGRGTTVKVYLQRTDDVAEPSEPAAGTRAAPLRTRRSILLVEDEEGVRQLLYKVLTRAGYTVHATSTLDEVRQLLAREEGTRLDLLITDVVLSQGSGREVAELVLGAHPESRALYMSGYSDDAVVRLGILTEQMPVLQKPFAAAALLEKVASLLSPTP